MKEDSNMKRFAIILGSILLVAAIAYPVLAHGPGWGRGHHMWGTGRAGGGPCWYGDRGYGNVTPEQRTQLDQVYQKFTNETAPLRNSIWSKLGELRTLLNTSKADPEKVMALQKEISDLKAKLAQKRVELELEARKIAPEAGYAGRYGRGYGHHMGYGHMGYGAGRCWN
jgi:zinc resistance-associated protein